MLSEALNISDIFVNFGLVSSPVRSYCILFDVFEMVVFIVVKTVSSEENLDLEG